MSAKPRLIKSFLLAQVAAAVALVAGIVGSASATLPPDAVPHQLVLKLGPDDVIGPINSKYGTTSLASLPDHNVHLLALPPQVSEQALLQMLSVNQSVEWVEFNISLGVTDGGSQSFFFSMLPADFHGQYVFELLQIDDVHQIAIGEGVVVAVLDTGVDESHELLAGRVLDGGYDFINMTAGAGESTTSAGALVGHGTFMAGLIAHVASGAMILPVKVLDGDGKGDAFHAAAGVLYAADHGAHIINASFGSTVDTKVLKYAVEQAASAGSLVIAAAGNQSQDDPVHYPAADVNAIGVAATDAADVKTVFSNFGNHIDLSAPGHQIVSALPGNKYASADGSSMSASLVSAAAAIVHSAQTAPSPQGLRGALTSAAMNIDGLNPDYITLLGAGRLRALEALQTTPAPGDLNGDGSVGVADLLILLAAWGPCANSAACPADLNGNGSVGVADLLILLSNWG